MVLHVKFRTVLSARGQITLPKAVREQRKWHEGTKLVVEDTADGVLLRSARVFPLTRPEDVFGVLAYKGKPKTIKEMNAGIVAEAKRRHARGRY